MIARKNALSTNTPNTAIPPPTNTPNQSEFFKPETGSDFIMISRAMLPAVQWINWHQIHDSPIDIDKQRGGNQLINHVCIGWHVSHRRKLATETHALLQFNRPIRKKSVGELKFNPTAHQDHQSNDNCRQAESSRWTCCRDQYFRSPESEPKPPELRQTSR